MIIIIIIITSNIIILGHWALDQPDISEGQCVQSHLSEDSQEWELTR